MISINSLKKGGSVGNKRLKSAYVGSKKVYEYDSTAPTLVINVNGGTSSSSPIYTTETVYRITGSAGDYESGLKAVYVNGVTATMQADGKWYCDVTLGANVTTEISIYAVDNAGNQSKTYKRYVYCDTVAPSLTVTNPAGTSSSSPTYVQNDSTHSYTVNGTVSDASGLKSVTVNGSAATISGNNWSKTLSLATNTTHTITVVATDNAGKTTTIIRYVRVEAFYQYYARLAGASPQSSLDATLKNSIVCNAIAGNSTAYNGMNSKYGSSIKSYMTSNWNDGLNTLNYVLGYKCYLVKSTQKCTGVTGGVTGLDTSYNYFRFNTNIMVSSNKLINLKPYKTVTFVLYSGTWWDGSDECYEGFCTASDQSNWAARLTAKNARGNSGRTDNLNISSLTGTYYLKLYCMNMGDSIGSNMIMDEIVLNP